MDYAFRDAPLIIPAIRSRGKNRFLCDRERRLKIPRGRVGLSSEFCGVRCSEREWPFFVGAEFEPSVPSAWQRLVEMSERFCVIPAAPKPPPTTAPRLPPAIAADEKKEPRLPITRLF
jgi:hypothetical protein